MLFLNQNFAGYNPGSAKPYFYYGNYKPYTLY